MKTVILCRPLHASGMALLEARHDVIVRTLSRPSQAELAAAMPGAHAVVVGLENVDEALLARLEAVISRVKNPSQAVFAIHPPPFGSGLDEAPELTKDLRPTYAGRSMVPVGSHAVMTVIDKYQPLLGLHGHIHEGKGTRKYKKTLCINPGSMYEQGMLNGAIIELKPQKVGNYLLTTG